MSLPENPVVLDMDGCGDVDRQLGHRWSGTSVDVSTDYGAFGYGLRVGAQAVRRFDPIEYMVMGFHLNVQGWSDPNAGPAIEFREGSIVKATLRFPSSGRVQYIDSLSNVVETAAGTWQLGVWQYIEILLRINPDAFGGVWLFQNNSGTPDIIIDNSDTQNAANGGLPFVDNVRFNTVGAGNVMWVDDWYLMDGYIFSLPLGGIQIVGRQVDADTLAQWTRSTGGTNYGTVQEVPFSATSYNTGAADGNQDLYGTADDGIEIEEVFAVRTIGQLKRTGAEPSTVQFLSDGDSLVNGTPIHLTTTPLVVAQVFANEPPLDLGHVWDRTEVNAASFGIERVAVTP